MMYGIEVKWVEDFRSDYAAAFDGWNAWVSGGDQVIPAALVARIRDRISAERVLREVCATVAGAPEELFDEQGTSPELTSGEAKRTGSHRVRARAPGLKARSADGPLAQTPPGRTPG